MLIGKWELKDEKHTRSGREYILDIKYDNTMCYTVLWKGYAENDTFISVNGRYKVDMDTITLSFDSASTLPVIKYIIKEINVNHLEIQDVLDDGSLNRISKYQRLN